MTTELIDARRSYVDGRWVDPEVTFPVENPADESTVAEAAVTPPARVEEAVAGARRAFDESAWADTVPEERARRLHRFLDHVESRREALVATMIAEAGQVRGYGSGPLPPT